MATPILSTKLYIPPPPPRVVPRPRLVDRLNEGLHRKLTLISAPAGFGKSTLLSDSIAAGDSRAAWLSLDEGDSDPTRFLTYLVAALQRIAPNIGEVVLSVLQDPQAPKLPPTESILTALLNEIAGMPEIPDKLVLVLDDYHVIDSSVVDQAVTFLLEHMPPQMHLVITSREDPQLPLARLRARDQLTELRAQDLRFTPYEAAEFLNRGMALALSAEDIDALEARTEGWIAGLQLAALSMQGNQDIPAFIRAFAGDHRYIADYLVEEVLQRQPESVRSFLLQTSILERLSGPLCNAVTGQQEGHTRLAALERGNFFVIPLDDRRQWYRYHQLFADVLYAHLMSEQPGQVSILHKRASEWYERNGSAADAIPNAIRHALAAEDFNRAADLVERALPVMRPSRQEAALLGWLRALPNEVFRCRPVLSAGYAEVLLGIGELEGVEDLLHDAERWLDPLEMRNVKLETRNREGSGAIPNSESPHSAFGTMVVRDEEAFRRLPAEIAVAHAGLALMLGDVANAVKYGQRVLDLTPEDDHLGAGSGAALLGLASWASGDLEAAHQTFAKGMAHLEMAGYLSDAIEGSVALADIRIAQGRLREAKRIYERGLQLATAGFPQRSGREQTAQGAPALRGAADMHVGMSTLHREYNDLDGATQHLLKSKELGEHNGFPQNRYRWCVAMARIREAEGDLAGALDMLHEAEHVYVRDFFPNVRPVEAMKARVWVAKGELEEAAGWVREQGLSAREDLIYLQEFEHITLARVLLARYKIDRADLLVAEAMSLLHRLLIAAEEGGRTGSLIEILVLQALAHHAQGDISAALLPLEQALTLAEPEGYIRMFVDEGMPMAVLLKEAGKRGDAPSYVRRLLAALGSAKERTPAKQALIEPLSERELEVLRLLRTELSGPEIAGELTVSLHTMRTHTNNIYNKLEVNNRRAAVRRAEELGLL